MRIIHVKSAGILSEQARKKLEEVFYPDMDGAIKELKAQFPNHAVSENSGFIRVTNKDGSINAALFKDATAGTNWVETSFGLRLMNE